MTFIRLNRNNSDLSRDSAYTLIELLIAVVIIGIFSSISISYITEISRGQIILQNLENMRSWLEATRRASLRGQACAVNIYTANLEDGSTVLQSSIVNNLNNARDLESNPCGNPVKIQLTSPNKDLRYRLSVRSDGNSVNFFTFTPRGTLYKDLADFTFSNDLIYALAITNQSNAVISNTYCMRVSGFLGSVQSIGIQACP